MSDPVPSPAPKPAQPSPAPDASTARISDDSSSQALSEALGSSFKIIKLAMVGLVALFFCSGAFVVQPNEVAIKLRLGKPVGTGADVLLKPGWHWAWPYPIDEKVRIPIGRSHTVTSSSGWHATSPEMEAANREPDARGYLIPEIDGYTLTADGNIIHVRATVKYHINDPLLYTFSFTSLDEILTNILNQAIFSASARTTADAALYKDKTAFRDLVMNQVQRKIEELQFGISLEPGDVETKAPMDVRGAFEAVNAAEQERSKTISEARGYRDEITRKALGEAEAVVNASIAASNLVVTATMSDASAFASQLPLYEQDARLFKERKLTATLQRVLTNSNTKFTLPISLDELRLQLSREPEKREAPERP